MLLKIPNTCTKKNKNILDNLGFKYIFDKNVPFKNDLKQIQQRIKDQNFQNRNSYICQSSKLNFFRNRYVSQKGPVE